MDVFCIDRRLNRIRRRVDNVVVTDFGDGRHVAPSHAGRADDTHRTAIMVRQIGKQLLGAHHLTGQAVAYPDRQFRQRCVTFLQDIEMRIEGRDLVGLRHRDAHLFSECGEVRRGDLIVFVLNQMEVFDQQVALPRPVAEQFCNLFDRCRDELPALGMSPPLAGPTTRVIVPA